MGSVEEFIEGRDAVNISFHVVSLSNGKHVYKQRTKGGAVVFVSCTLCIKGWLFMWGLSVATYGLFVVFLRRT